MPDDSASAMIIIKNGTHYRVVGEDAEGTAHCLTQWHSIYPDRVLGPSIWVKVSGLPIHAARAAFVDSSGSTPESLSGTEQAESEQDCPSDITIDPEATLAPHRVFVPLQSAQAHPASDGSGCEYLDLVPPAIASNPHSVALNRLWQPFAFGFHRSSLRSVLWKGEKRVSPNTCTWPALCNTLAEYSKDQVTEWTQVDKIMNDADCESYLDEVTVLFLDEATGTLCAKASLYRKAGGDYVSPCDLPVLLLRMLPPCKLEDASCVQDLPEADNAVAKDVPESGSGAETDPEQESDWVSVRGST